MTGRRAAWAVIAGGGTAGHVLPALAVADALVAIGHDRASIRFVGSARGIDARLVREAGYPLTLLPGRGIQRRITLANVGSAGALCWSILRMVAGFAVARPSVVLSVGGYASVPCAVAAAVWRVPLVLAEANAKAGAANRLVARRARVCAVAFATTGLPRAELTGNPVRSEIAELGDESVRQKVRITTRKNLGIPEGSRMVVVFGGSLGARRINEAAIGAADLWADRSDLVLYLVTGERDAQLGVDARAAWHARFPSARLDWRVVGYERAMPGVLAAADVVVCRAGATSVADTSAAALPVILVPLPTAAEDHQTANAQAVVADGAAILVPDAELDAARLVAETDAILGDDARAQRMSGCALARSRPGAAAAVAALVDRSGRSGRSGEPAQHPRPTDDQRLG